MRYAIALFLLLAAVPSAAARQAFVNQDWPLYGYDTARSNNGPVDTLIDASNVKTLVRQHVSTGGVVDSSPIYLHGVDVNGSTHDVVFATTTYGKTDAIDADNGTILWQFVPPAYNAVKGTRQITNATPAADPSATAIYAAASDGFIRKLSVEDGSVEWATSITNDPTHEKITSPLNVANGIVYATTGGYIGDAPPYQGHVVTLDPDTGAIEHVWNSLCADRHALIVPSSCSASDSAIWSRNGAALDPETGEIVAATGNGPWNGTTNFGDTVVILSADASTLLRFWTPSNYQFLNDHDVDLGSTSPAFLPGGYAVQGGKDGILKLINLRQTTLVQTFTLPGQDRMFSEPAVSGLMVYVSVPHGTVAYRFVRKPPFQRGSLTPVWSNTVGGTSPVVAGGLLYVAGYDGRLHVLQPATGATVATLPTGVLHWQSPIVADGRVIVGEGNANDHRTTGVLDIFRLP